MDSIRILEVVAAVKIGKERWQGEAYYLVTDDYLGNPELHAQIARDAYSGLIPLIAPWEKVASKFRIETHTLKGKLASDMLHHLGRVDEGKKPRFSWTPLVVTRWNLMGGLFNG